MIEAKNKLYLDEWIKRKIGLNPGDAFTRPQLETYQLQQIRQVIARAKERSSFYREHLKRIDPDSINTFQDFEWVPFCNDESVRIHGHAMLCVGQGQISRIITQETSGTSGPSKRVYFTEADQERTTDFFQYGMKCVAEPTDVVFILMPCRTKDSIGGLLYQGLTRSGVKAIPYGLPVKGFCHVAETMAKKGATVVVGMPVHVLQAAIACEPGLSIHSVLLSADYVPDSLCRHIEEIWSCDVFTHYGMTEIGYGGAVQCHRRQGMHIREADLYVEIIDQHTGKQVMPGQWGEITITTLTQDAMPFIRYRTGDQGRLMEEPCSCGSILKSIDKVHRDTAVVFDLNGKKVSMADLDEAMFAIPGLCDYKAYLVNVDKRQRIQLDLEFSPYEPEMTEKKLTEHRFSFFGTEDFSSFAAAAALGRKRQILE